MTQTPLLTLAQIGKKFAERHALRDVSFSVHKGEVLTLLGPSGCGKTTLLRLIAGLETADAGMMTRAPTLSQKGQMGYVFQDATLMPWASAETNVALPLHLLGIERHESRKRARSMLETVGLQDAAQAAPHELSGGMKMRVALARALITKPTLLLMDEPFASLDEITRHALNDQMLNLIRSTQTTVMFVTHSVAEACYISDRVLIMSHRPGTVMEDMKMPWGTQRTPTLRKSSDFARATTNLSAALGRAMNDNSETGSA